MTRTPSICAVVLTLNEERDLPRCLQSLSWCDEILVVDSGSEDGTHAVARQHGAKFLSHIQNGKFLISQQRNWCLDSAGIKSDWILFLDADEEINPKLSHAILTELSTSSLYDSYQLCPRYWFLGKWLKYTQGFPNWHSRLVRRGTSYFVGGVWEAFSPTAKTGRIKTPYEHYAFSKGLDDWLTKHLKYADWDAQLVLRSLNQQSSIEHTELGSKYHLRYLSTKLWQLKPLTRFIYKYIICRGFLDGWQGLIYSLLMATYEIIVIVKVLELSRRARGLPV